MCRGNSSIDSSIDWIKYANTYKVSQVWLKRARSSPIQSPEVYPSTYIRRSLKLGVHRIWPCTSKRATRVYCKVVGFAVGKHAERIRSQFSILKPLQSLPFWRLELKIKKKRLLSITKNKLISSTVKCISGKHLVKQIPTTPLIMYSIILLHILVVCKTVTCCFVNNGHTNKFQNQFECHSVKFANVTQLLGSSFPPQTHIVNCIPHVEWVVNAPKSRTYFWNSWRELPSWC